MAVVALLATPVCVQCEKIDPCSAPLRLKFASFFRGRLLFRIPVHLCLRFAKKLNLDLLQFNKNSRIFANCSALVSLAIAPVSCSMISGPVNNRLIRRRSYSRANSAIQIFSGACASLS